MSIAYFISDTHILTGSNDLPGNSELALCRWFDIVREDADKIYLLGDIFDFWFEYKHVVPKGAIPVISKIRELVADGIEINWYTGNHDMWMTDYLKEYAGVNIFDQDGVISLNGTKFFIGHGDRTPKTPRGYMLLQAIFRSSFLGSIARVVIHPDFMIGLGRWWSGKSRASHGDSDMKFLGENEYQIGYAREIADKYDVDYVIFGHRHLHFLEVISLKCKLIILQDSIKSCFWAKFDGKFISLHEKNI